MEPSKSSLETRNGRSSRGMTLLEVGLSIMILAILSVGVSSLVRAGVESQMARRSNINMQTVGLNIVDDMRQDLRTADQAIISNGGNTLTILPPNGAPNIIYQLSAGKDFTRTDLATGATKIYNDPNIYQPKLQVLCQSGANATPCFTGLRKSPANPAVLIADNTTPQEIQLNNIVVNQATLAGGGTIIDQAFGNPGFAIRDTTLSILSQTDFQ